jgi:hypothetical protein
MPAVKEQDHTHACPRDGISAVFSTQAILPSATRISELLRKCIENMSEYSGRQVTSEAK